MVMIAILAYFINNILNPVYFTYKFGSNIFIAICNNVGEPAFLGPNQNFENQLPQAS